MNTGPQYSPDRKFYWDGERWVPAPQPMVTGRTGFGLGFGESIGRSVGGCLWPLAWLIGIVLALAICTGVSQTH